MSVDLAGEVSLETAADLSQSSSFCGSSLDVGPGLWVHAHAGDDGHVQRPVQAAVAATIEPVADGVA